MKNRTLPIYFLHYLKSFHVQKTPSPLLEDASQNAMGTDSRVHILKKHWDWIV